MKAALPDDAQRADPEVREQIARLRARPDARPANGTENLSGAFSVRSGDAFGLYRQARIKGLDAPAVNDTQVGEPQPGEPLDLDPERPSGRYARSWSPRPKRAA